MAYRKVLVDNTSCSRRFHIAFDDESPSIPHAEIRCNYCQEVVFAVDNHPPIRLAREENLIKMTNLSDNVISQCSFEDKMPKG